MQCTELWGHPERGQMLQEAGAMGIKWETMKMGQIRVELQSLTEQLGCDGACHGALGGLQQMQEVRWGCV